MLEKKLHQHTFKLAHHFFLQIMQILTQYTSAEVCTYYGEMMGLGQGIPPFEFKVGERVTTVPGKNVKTQRTGYIITRSYHMNDKTNLYYLMVDGKILVKRYLPADLIKADVQEEQHKL
ncbi:hypothetical protein [Chitinophaga rhizophila]|uniref:Uncharacterized protein n=1 Tax=Chitinophaga rhizophila TaxID=2866212 RepID=A0ABS7G882_9BACT|nr:hypothetical protein [Chitinophaga rhizophila]MBW8683854.1 hypothetical protein [Chitinophaga rhizophila]